jgi:hypothetical protein
VYLFFFEKVIGKIGISYFTYRKMQPRRIPTFLGYDVVPDDVECYGSVHASPETVWIERYLYLHRT